MTHPAKLNRERQRLVLPAAPLRPEVNMQRGQPVIVHYHE
jgi:hypothetical protein